MDGLHTGKSLGWVWVGLGMAGARYQEPNVAQPCRNWGVEPGGTAAEKAHRFQVDRR